MLEHVRKASLLEALFLLEIGIQLVVKQLEVSLIILSSPKNKLFFQLFITLIADDFSSNEINELIFTATEWTYLQ